MPSSILELQQTSVKEEKMWIWFLLFFLPWITFDTTELSRIIEQLLLSSQIVTRYANRGGGA